jgi:hypothetical protein
MPSSEQVQESSSAHWEPEGREQITIPCLGIGCNSLQPLLPEEPIQNDGIGFPSLYSVLTMTVWPSLSDGEMLIVISAVDQFKTESRRTSWELLREHAIVLSGNQCL